MLTYDLSEGSGLSLYEQLYNHIKQDILSGSISANEKLPSKRNLAKQLSISVMTVENSYNQLLSEGFIYSLPRKGFYASDIGDMYAFYNEPDMSYKNKNVERYGSPDKEKQADQQERSNVNEYGNKDFIDFASNATDPATFPFATWAKLTRRILSDDQELLMKNPPSNGLIDLRIAISNYLHAFRGIDVNPDNIIVGAGTENIYSLLIQLLGHDKIYGVENPGYKKIGLTLDSNSVRCIRIDMDEYGIKPDLLESNLVDIIHTTPSHHFPTGITMPIKRRYELLKWASKDEARYIIEDDYDSEFRLNGKPIPSLYSIDTHEKVIYMNTFTKSLASTIRISYMILPDHLMKEYNKRLSFYASNVPNFEQLVLAKFISEGYYEKHINRMRNISRKKRDLLLECIKKGALSDISEISEEKSGLHFILRLKHNKSEDDFKKACEKNSINIISVGKESYMINYSSIPLDKIEIAIKRLEESAVNHK